jgi:hypothetical protein
MAKNIRAIRCSVSLPCGLWKHGISPKAIGLLYTIISLSDIPDWEFSVNGLVKVFANADVTKGIGKEAITAGIHELEAKRFLIREQSTGKDGQFGSSNWIVSESPIPDWQEQTPVPATGEPLTANPATANPAQYRNPIEEKKNNKAGSSDSKQNRTSRDDIVFAEAVRDIWNEEAPAHWPRIASQIGSQRLRRVKALVGEVGSPDEALEVLCLSLRAAHREGWCMKPDARLTIENWLSNGKPLQYAEKAAATAPGAARSGLSSEQEAMLALAGERRDLFVSAAPWQQGIEVRFCQRAIDAGYPETSRVSTMGSLQLEINHLSDTLARNELDPLPCPW